MIWIAVFGAAATLGGLSLVWYELTTANRSLKDITLLLKSNHDQTYEIGHTTLATHDLIEDELDRQETERIPHHDPNWLDKQRAAQAKFTLDQKHRLSTKEDTR